MMFRTLRTRLVASYVLGAMVLVIVVGAAVTIFALSTFAIVTNDSVAGVARDAPELVKLSRAQHRSLDQAASDIVRRLCRPGLRVALFASSGDRGRLLAAADSDGPQGCTLALTAPIAVPKGEKVGSFGFSHGPPPRGAGDLPPPPKGVFIRGESEFEKKSQLPFALNLIMRMRPRTVDVPGGSIVVFADPRPLSHTINTFWLAMLPIGLALVVAAYLLGRYITNQALRPLVETTAALNRFGGGDFTPRSIVSADRSEIGELVTAYNAAVAQVAAAFEERRNAELQMRQFVADAGHELRTPLTVIMGFIDVLRRRGSSDASTRIYDTMMTESRRMRALIDKLIVLARLENPEHSEMGDVNVSDLASRVVSALGSLQTKPRVALHVEPNVVVSASELELYEAIANLVENALKYAPLSPVDVTVRAVGENAVVEVADRGPGMTPDDQRHAFDRFYRGTNRGDSEGFGLGLAIVKRAIERSNGAIQVDTGPGKGCRFVITLPRLQAERVPA